MARSIATWIGIAATCLAILVIPIWSAAVDASSEASSGRFFDITGAANDGPRPCRSSFVESSVHTFFETVNGGRPASVDSVVATGSRFRVYSQTQRYGSSSDGFFSSRARSQVVDHLIKRQARGDRYRVRDLDPNGYDRSFEICNLGFAIDRRIGGGPWRPFVGKGALDWPSGAISVWNIGGQCERDGAGPCPGR